MEENNTAIPNLDRTITSAPIKKEENDLWDQVGFHKSMAGFWYNLILTIMEMLFGLIMSGVFLSFLWPFPESQGYSGVVWSLFSLLFQIFDLGTASTIERFIADSRIKDIRRMVKYIQWFIWYQSMSGLVQITILSVYIFKFASATDLAYLSWLMIVVSIQQFPGYFGVFKATLDALQIYNKSNLLGFIQGQLVGRLVDVGFLIGFKYYGRAHVEIGEMMGIAIGSTLGGYVSSLLSLFLSAYFFTIALKDQGISVRDCFRVEFDWPLVKEVLAFGLKTGLPGVLFGSLNYTIFLMYLNYVPQYTTMSRLVGMASTLLWIMGRAGGASTALYSESYLNGKKHLVQFYLAQSWRFIMQIQFFLISILGAVYFILPDAFKALNILYYNSIFPFLFPIVAQYILNGFYSQCDPIIIGSNRPMVNFVIGFIWTLANMLFSYLLLVVYRVPYMGMGGIMFVMIFKDMILLGIFGTVKYLYIHYRIVPIKYPFWQAIISTSVACGVSFLISYGLKLTIYNYLYAHYGFIVAVFPMFILWLVCGIPVYFAMNGLLGGFDTENLEYFRKCIEMSGPSKGLVKVIYAISEKASHKSRLFNRFPIPWDVARKEMDELYTMKKAQVLKLKEY